MTWQHKTVTHHKGCFACLEGSKICSIANQGDLVHHIQAVAYSSTFLQAVGPLHSTSLQFCDLPISNWQHAMQSWLHVTKPCTEGSVFTKTTSVTSSDAELNGMPVCKVSMCKVVLLRSYMTLGPSPDWRVSHKVHMWPGRATTQVVYTPHNRRFGH